MSFKLCNSKASVRIKSSQRREQELQGSRMNYTKPEVKRDQWRCARVTQTTQTNKPTRLRQTEMLKDLKIFFFSGS